MFLNLTTRSSAGRPLQWIEEDGNLNTISQAIEALDGEQVFTRLRGDPIDILGPLTPVNGGVRGEWLRYIDQTNVGGYGIQRLEYTKAGRVSDGLNDIGTAIIAHWNDIHAGYAWQRWDVASSPLNEGSGLPGAPTVSQQFAIITREINPQNRYAQLAAFQPETRLLGATWTAGEQMVAETQDFSGKLNGERPGYDVAFGWMLSKSPITSTFNGRHARFKSGWLTLPNAVAGGSFAHFSTGYRPFATAVAIVTPGTGYQVGDLMLLATGTDQFTNDDTLIRVLTVNGSGGITGAEVYAAGSYTASFINPKGVYASAHGSGATFNCTLSDQSTETPAAWAAIAGRWGYGVDFCALGPAHYATFSGAPIRLPNLAGIVSRNAGDSGDVLLLRLDGTDHVEIAGNPIKPWTAWTPTLALDNGTLASHSTVVNVIGANWAEIHKSTDFNIALQVVSKGTGSVLHLSGFPSTPASNHTWTGTDTLTGKALRVFYDVALNYARVTYTDGTDALIDGTFFEINGRYQNT